MGAESVRAGACGEAACRALEVEARALLDYWRGYEKLLPRELRGQLRRLEGALHGQAAGGRNGKGGRA